MKITNKGLKELADSLAKVSGLSGVKFAFAIAKNSAKLKPELSTLQEVVNKIKGLEEYDIEIKAIRTNTKDEASLIKAVADLNEKYKEPLKEWSDLMGQEVDFPVHKIKKENVPEEINASQLEGILSIIDDE